MARRAKAQHERIEPGFGPGHRPEAEPQGERRRPVRRDRRGGSASPPAPPTERRRFSLWRFTKGSLYWGSLTALWAFIGVIGIFVYYGLQLPHTSEWSIPDRPPNVRIVSVEGRLLGNRGETGGEAVTVDELPDVVTDAVIAIEDHRFRSHFGLDPVGFTRAMIKNVQARNLVEGGSTLTQQLAKNLFLTPERSFRRKVQELILAFWLEAEFTKDEILELYLNRVYYGGGAYGIDAASRTYFGRSAREIGLAEAAMLAGLLKAPSYYAPNRHLERARSRSELVLAAMVREGYISSAEAEAARKDPPKIASAGVSRSENYVADLVMERLPHYLGAIEQNVTVETTVDLHLQRTAEWALVEALKDDGKTLGVEQGALVAMDGTGAVRALVGGRNYAKSQFNRATDAHRQPGSAFKPFVYLAALEAGLTPSSVRTDEPVQIGDWTPQNYSREFRGPVTLETALALSLNTVAAILADEVGPENVVSVAHRLGINSSLEPNPSIALGTSEVTPIELVGAYAPFANGGHAVVPHVISRIVGEDGKVLFQRAGASVGQAIDPVHVAQMNRMLVTTLERGTGRKAAVEGWQAAGKTGTSQSLRDAWFVGYTANLVTGVWFGNDSNEPSKKATGGNLPASTFARFMNAAHEGVPPRALPGLDAPQRNAPLLAVGRRSFEEERFDSDPGVYPDQMGFGDRSRRPLAQQRQRIYPPAEQPDPRAQRAYPPAAPAYPPVERGYGYQGAPEDRRFAQERYEEPVYGVPPAPSGRQPILLGRRPSVFDSLFGR